MEIERHESSRRRSLTGLALCAFLVIAAFFLLTEHRAHLFGALPWLLLLACPLLHLLHGHGGQGSATAQGQSKPNLPEGGRS